MIDELIGAARAMDCSDVHIACGEPPIVRRNGELKRLNDRPVFTAPVIAGIAREMLQKSGNDGRPEEGDIDFSYQTPSGERQRVNIFRQRDELGIAIRLLQKDIPTIGELNLPEIFAEIADYPRGLVLVTGPTGSGKSTTLAAMIDAVNEKRSCHILTLEDPVEYMHTSKKSMVNQREIGRDAENFSSALRSALREDPDVILVGEMRDLETISSAITAAETGHLVMSTLHTIGAAKTIDRIIDVFPPYQQQQVRTQLATVLRAVITQTLIPRVDGRGRVPAFEIMLVNDAVANLVREGKTFQIASVLQTNMRSGMISLDMYLARLVKEGTITMEAALDRAASKEELKRYVQI
ncbi:type IV pilus twitching motility protein PilT [Christensenella intestinihominis]|uniref:type IV pilus twitching motility protein PilT n=1 Tax=Christensenella intestinihominis TaxID=1851429 RepID=UPI00082F7B4D|nr:type IV pilus twitching motility protein PilT [Christensenella intestinihominis]